MRGGGGGGGVLSASGPIRKAGEGGCCPFKARYEKRKGGGGGRGGGAVQRFRPDRKSGEGGGAV